jgi:hypothetical protein
VLECLGLQQVLQSSFANPKQIGVVPKPVEYNAQPIIGMALDQVTRLEQQREASVPDPLDGNRAKHWPVMGKRSQKVEHPRGTDWWVGFYPDTATAAKARLTSRDMRISRRVRLKTSQAISRSLHSVS